MSYWLFSLGRSAAGSADAGQQPRPGGAAQEADAGRGRALSTSGGRQPTTVTSHNIKIQEGVIEKFYQLAKCCHIAYTLECYSQ